MVKEEAKTPTSARNAKTPQGVGRPVHMWAVQCGKCFKWRTVGSQEEFEEIRSNFKEDPFFCEKKPNFTCDDPADIEYDSTRTWAVDKPNLPKTPVGFTRRLVMRKDFSKFDIYYQAPSGKTLRSGTEVSTYLQQNPHLTDVEVSQFSFISPKILGETTPVGTKRKAVSGVYD